MRINIKSDNESGFMAVNAENQAYLGWDRNLNRLVIFLRQDFPGADIFNLVTNTWIDYNSNNKQQKLEPATRYDAGKIPYHLFPLDAYEEICKVMQFGAKKYAERNWEQGMSWSRVARSMLSHFISMCRGEQNDEESNLPHAAHMAWNAIVLLAYTLRPKLRNLNDLSNLYSGTKE